MTHELPTDSLLPSAEETPRTAAAETPRTAAAAPHVLACGTPADFLSVLPHLLGFEPRSSLAVVRFVGTRSREVLRMDLPPDESPGHVDALLDTVRTALDSLAGEDHGSGAGPAAPTGSHADEHAAEHTAEHTGARASAEPAARVSLGIALFTEVRFAGGGPPWQRLAARLRARLPRAGYPVRELCCRAPDGWVSYLADTWPRSGRPLSELALAPVALSAALQAGALPDQRVLGRIPRAAPEQLRAVAAALGSHLGEAPLLQHPPLGDPEWLARADALAQSLRRSAPLRPAHTARLIAELRDHRVWAATALGILSTRSFSARLSPGGATERRLAALPVDDATPGAWSLYRLLALLSPQFTDRPRLLSVRARLAEVIAECPPAHRAPLYAFSAWVWWLSGMQSVAEQHVTAAERSSPADPLVPMLRTLISVPSHVARASAPQHERPQPEAPPPRDQSAPAESRSAG